MMQCNKNGKLMSNQIMVVINIYVKTWQKVVFFLTEMMETGIITISLFRGHFQRILLALSERKITSSRNQEKLKIPLH